MHHHHHHRRCGFRNNGGGLLLCTFAFVCLLGQALYNCCTLTQIIEIPQLLRSQHRHHTAVRNHAVTLPTTVWHCSLFGRSRIISAQRLFGSCPLELSRYSDLLRARRSGNRIPVEAIFVAPRPDRPLGPTQPLVQLLPGFYLGSKAAESWR